MQRGESESGPSCIQSRCNSQLWALPLHPPSHLVKGPLGLGFPNLPQPHCSLLFPQGKECGEGLDLCLFTSLSKTVLSVSEWVAWQTRAVPTRNRRFHKGIGKRADVWASSSVFEGLRAGGAVAPTVLCSLLLLSADNPLSPAVGQMGVSVSFLGLRPQW